MHMEPFSAFLSSVKPGALSSHMECSIVIDAGSASVKAGYSGEDMPRSVFPSVVPEDATKIRDKSVGNRSGRPECIECYPDSAACHPIRRGFIDEARWDKMERLWDLTLGHELNAYAEGNTISSSVLLAEAPGTPAASRQRVAQIMFETLKVPALCFFNSASLSLFASGRTRGIVLECGAGVSNAVPVFEGFALAHAIRRSELAGADITSVLAENLRSQDASRDWCMSVLCDVKERLCCVKSLQAGKPSADEAEYELPDGTMVKIAAEHRASAPEILFTPCDERCPLHELVAQSISMCDRDLQTDLRGAVVLAGGTTMLPGFCHRVKEELVKAYPTDGVRVIPGPNSNGTSERGYNSQRKHASWIGGSMFASLETFKEVRVTKQEWEDDEGVIHQKTF